MNQFTNQAPAFSMLDILTGIGRRKMMILSGLILGFGLGFGIVAVNKPAFQTEARVIVDNFSTPYDAANVTQASARETLIDERTINSQVVALQSSDLAMRVVRDLRLGEKSEFDSMKGGIGLVSQLLIRFGFKDDPRLMTIEQRALDHLFDKIVVYPIPVSNSIGIKYTAGDGETAAAVANAMAEKYVLSTRESKSGDNDRARKWLSEQIGELRGRVSKSEAEVEKFRAEAGLLKGSAATLSTQQLSELSTQITQAEAAKSEAEAKADEIRSLLESQGTVDASSEVLNSSTVQRLREQQVAAERRYGELSATYLENHPKMIAAKRDIANVERQIRRETLKIVDGLQGQAKIAEARAASLRKSLEGLKTREGANLQDDVKLKELEREAKANRDQLEAMLSRFADSNTRQNLELQPGFARIIQYAQVPATPYFPRVGPMILLTTLAGLGLTLGLAFLLEVIGQASRMAPVGGSDAAQQPRRSRHAANRNAESEIDIPQLPIVPVEAKVEPTIAAAVRSAAAPLVMATVPMVPSALSAHSLLNALSKEGNSDTAMEDLAWQLEKTLDKSASKACAFASVGSHNEVAVTTLAIGRALSANGLKSIVVDLEANRSLLPDLLELPNAPGLVELLAGSSDFSKAIQRDKQSEMQFIRYGNLAYAGKANLTQRMEAITQTLTGIYDVVLLHMGEATPAMLELTKGCTTALLVASTERQKDALAAASTLQSKGFEQVLLVRADGSMQAAA
jgi:succinoglycan biosynthesis transport protein ExoP